MPRDVTWSRVARALLGRWPSQVAQWGEHGIAAYVEELQAERLEPDEALNAIRRHRPARGGDFPPSVAQVLVLARRQWRQRDYLRLRAQFERRELRVAEQGGGQYVPPTWAQIEAGESNDGGVL